MTMSKAVFLCWCLSDLMSYRQLWWLETLFCEGFKISRRRQWFLDYPSAVSLPCVEHNCSLSHISSQHTPEEKKRKLILCKQLVLGTEQGQNEGFSRKCSSSLLSSHVSTHFLQSLCFLPFMSLPILSFLHMHREGRALMGRHTAHSAVQARGCLTLAQRSNVVIM